MSAFDDAARALLLVDLARDRVAERQRMLVRAESRLVRAIDDVVALYGHLDAATDDLEEATRLAAVMIDRSEAA